jgi:hypothetical protein
VKDHQVIDLEEYKQLRAEILVRLSLHNQLTSYTVAAMAAALTIFPAVPDVLLAISFLASWFLGALCQPRRFYLFYLSSSPLHCGGIGPTARN